MNTETQSIDVDKLIKEIIKKGKKQYGSAVVEIEIDTLRSILKDVW